MADFLNIISEVKEDLEMLEINFQEISYKDGILKIILDPDSVKNFSEDFQEFFDEKLEIENRYEGEIKDTLKEFYLDLYGLIFLIIKKLDPKGSFSWDESKNNFYGNITMPNGEKFQGKLIKAFEKFQHFILKESLTIRNF